MTLQPFGVKVKEKKAKRPTFWQIISLILSIALATATVYSAISSDYYSRQNITLQNLLYNFTPVIFSNDTSSSTLRNFDFRPNETVIFLEGMVNIDLKVDSPFDGMLTVNVKNISFTDPNSLDSEVTYYYVNMSLAKYASTSFFLNNHQYEYPILKNVMNPVTDKLWVQAYVYLNSGVLRNVFRDQGTNSTTMVGFPLGNITFEATLHLAQKNQDFSQDFNDGISCEIDKNVGLS